jgi:hypothetical protein
MRQLVRPRRTMEYNIKIYSSEKGFGVWIEFIWLRIVTYGGLL